MGKEKVYIVQTAHGRERVRAEKPHFLGETYRSARLLVLKSGGQVKAAYSPDAWMSVYEEGALVE